MKTGRKITYEAIFSQVHGSYGNVQGSFDAELAKALRNTNNEKGKLPPWYPRFPGWEEIETTPAIKMVEFIVCGDPAQKQGADPGRRRRHRDQGNQAAGKMG